MVGGWKEVVKTEIGAVSNENNTIFTISGRIPQKNVGSEFLGNYYPCPTRVLPVLTPYLPVSILANPGFVMGL